MNEHAQISLLNGVVELRPAEQGAKIKINGQPVTGTQTLVNKDRVMFGMFIYMNGPSVCLVCMPTMQVYIDLCHSSFMIPLNGHQKFTSSSLQAKTQFWL